MMALLKYLRNPWVLVAVLLLLIFLYWKLFGKGGSLISIFNPAPLPDSSSTGVELTPQQAATVRSLAMRLHDDMTGWNLNVTRDLEAWQQFASLSNDLFTAVYNDFGNLYFSEGLGTMRQWISDEWTWYDTSGVASKQTILNRMSALNLQ